MWLCFRVFESYNFPNCNSEKMPIPFAKGNSLRRETAEKKNAVSLARQQNAIDIGLNVLGNTARKLVEHNGPSYYTINTRMTKRVQIDPNEDKLVLGNIDCLRAFTGETSRIIGAINVCACSVLLIKLMFSIIFFVLGML